MARKKTKQRRPADAKVATRGPSRVEVPESTGVRWHPDDREILGAIIRHLNRVEGTGNTTLIGVLRKAIRSLANELGCMPKRFRARRSA
jgi:hypothetical protein